MSERLSAKEAAAFLGMSRGGLNWLRLQGALPAVCEGRKTRGFAYSYSVDDLAAYRDRKAASPALVRRDPKPRVRPTQKGTWALPYVEDRGDDAVAFMRREGWRIEPLGNGRYRVETLRQPTGTMGLRGIEECASYLGWRATPRRED